MVQNIWTNFQYPFNRRSHVKSCEIGQAVWKTFKEYTILHMYKPRGKGR